MLNRSLISHCIHRFPPVSFAFAYGSAVLPQHGKLKGGKMLDLCFVIDDDSSQYWHRENLLRNASDYSFAARILRADLITSIQRSNTAAVWYNTLVPIKNLDFSAGSPNDNTVEYIKYGVIEKRDFLFDLKHWRSLYLSGRCHKPLSYLDRLPPSEDLRSALENNLNSALYTALLQLPLKFSIEDLFTCIVGLSYHGDFRMLFGEDRDKIRKLVVGALPQLLELYLPLIKNDNSLQFYKPSVTDLTKCYIEQDLSFSVKLDRLISLPSTLRNNLLYLNSFLSGHSVWQHRIANPDVEEILAAMASWSDGSRLAQLLDKATRKIVFTSSVSQTAKGVLTAGPIKSVRYAVDKVGKSVKSYFTSKK